MIPVTIDGVPVKLATFTYKPPGDGPFPTLIFHHGSTGSGVDPTQFAQPFEPDALAAWFVARGWAVVVPERRGRGGSEGLYDEGFDPDRAKGYTCEPTAALAGAERGLRDIDAATAAILAWPFVDRARFAVGGLSRGGILAVAWAGRHPEQPRATINFVGGWLGTKCPTSNAVNRRLFATGAAYRKPTLWLYGDHDPLYSLAVSRGNFAAFREAGGRGAFHAYPPPPTLSGHAIFGMPALWEGDVEAYLEGRGFPTKRIK